jgi:hypothetical protein
MFHYISLTITLLIIRRHKNEISAFVDALSSKCVEEQLKATNFPLTIENTTQMGWDLPNSAFTFVQFLLEKQLSRQSFNTGESQHGFLSVGFSLSGLHGIIKKTGIITKRPRKSIEVI